MYIYICTYNYELMIKISFRKRCFNFIVLAILSNWENRLRHEYCMLQDGCRLCRLVNQVAAITLVVYAYGFTRILAVSTWYQLGAINVSPIWFSLAACRQLIAIWYPQHNWIHLTCSTCEALCLIDISIIVEKGVCGRIPSPYCKCEFHFQKPWVPVHPGSIVDLLHFFCSHCQGMGSHCPPPLHLIWSKLMSQPFFPNVCRFWHPRSPLSASLAPLPGRVRPALKSMLRCGAAAASGSWYCTLCFTSQTCMLMGYWWDTDGEKSEISRRFISLPNSMWIAGIPQAFPGTRWPQGG